MPKYPKSWRGRSDKHTVKEQERRAARRLDIRGGARAVPASGRFPFAKGDAESRFDLHECKQTANKQFTLKIDVLRKIESEAIEKGKVPGLVFEFLSQRKFDAKRAERTREWIVIPVWFYEMLLTAYCGEEDGN